MKHGQISSYASGNGALSVGRCHKYNGNQWTMVYHNITLDEVKKYRDENFPTRVIVAEKRPDNSFYFLLAQPYKRVGQNALQHPLTKEIFNYANYDRNEDFCHSMIVTFHHPDFGTMKVKHISTLSQIRYFLHNEEKVISGI